jgi:hypothetical protein
VYANLGVISVPAEESIEIASVGVNRVLRHATFGIKIAQEAILP